MAEFAKATASLGTTVLLFTGLVVLYRVFLVAYRLFFHPLSGFPGPKLYAVSYLPLLLQEKVFGTFTTRVGPLHDKYGPIVRIGPNHLAFDGSIGWREIFQRRPNQAEFEKKIEFFALPKRVGILTSFREDHRRQRRLMSHAFSEGALVAQETYIKAYVDLLMKRLTEQAQVGKPVEMTRWYNFTTFDIIGDLAFADPFDSLARSDYHPWVTRVFTSLKAAARIGFLLNYPLLRPLLFFMIGKKEAEQYREFNDFARLKTEKRVALGSDSRQDFMAYILRHSGDKDKSMTPEELVQNSQAMIVAGSETTATTLSGLTFHMAQNPDAYKKLADEVRAAFSSEEEINMKSTAPLQYLHACIEETLRIYPPASITPTRESPGDFVDGQYIPRGTSVTIYLWATNHSPRNFTDPDLFRPQRWLPPSHPLYDPRYASDNRAAFKPFSAGPRDCLGKNLAYAEMRLIVARLFYNFDFSLLAGQDDWVSKQKVFLVWEKGPLMVDLKPRAAIAP